MNFIKNGIPNLRYWFVRGNITFERPCMSYKILSRRFNRDGFNTNIEKKYRTIDNISSDYMLISSMKKIISINNYYVVARLFLVLGPAIFLVVKYYDSRYESLEITELEKEFKNKVTHRTLKTCILGFSYLVFSISIIVLSRAVPFRIYRHPEKNLYKGIFVGEIPFTYKTVTFSKDLVKPAFKKDSIIPNSDVLFLVDNRLTILHPDCFKSLYEYEILTR